MVGFDIIGSTLPDCRQTHRYFRYDGFRLTVFPKKKEEGKRGRTKQTLTAPDPPSSHPVFTERNSQSYFMLPAKSHFKVRGSCSSETFILYITVRLIHDF